MAKAVPGAGDILVGSNWAIECATAQSCENDQKAIGGDMLSR
jgi:hypothetical protein